MTALTERQKRLFATAEPGETGLETLSLFHPAWDAPEHLTSAPDAFQGLVRGSLVTFRPWVFAVFYPRRGDDGLYRMRVNIGIGDAAHVAKLLSARPGLDADPEGIEAELNQYIEGETAPQDVTLTLTLGAARKQDFVISAEGTLHDFLNIGVPRLLYRPDLFRGLDR